MAPLYSRYVPAKASVVGVTSNVAAAVQPSEPVQSTESSDGRKKRKRSETDVKDRKAPKHARSSGKEGPEVRDVKDSASGKIKKSKKERKDKKEHREGDDAQDDMQEDESRPSKHDAVFSKFQKAAARSIKLQEAGEGKAETEDVEDQPELHDIVPLPQKERGETPDYVPTFSALPNWLAHPITVSQSTTKPFSELSLSAKTVAQLESKGWTNAFAVQAALFPLLLPHPYLTHLPPNDVCVSAPTGSGKTLGYVLPIIESLRSRADVKLRAVIVVPTRELVQQAHEVAISCSAGTGLRIAVAVGNQTLAAEQESLIKKGRKYDPLGHAYLMHKAKRRIHHEDDSDDEDTDENALSVAKNAAVDDIVHTISNHVPTYTSAIDILICTPGRLVEHMTSTAGFTLDDVQWLIIDEADRLLDQSFQEWVSKVVGALEATKSDSGVTPVDRDAALAAVRQPKDRYVRKVILSATMTRDIAKLSALRLRRPSLVQVKGTEERVEDGDVEASAVDGADVFELPRMLKEYAVPVGDGLDKPLFLLQLLESKILPKGAIKIADPDGSDGSSDDDSDSDSDSSDSSSSDSDSSSSNSDSDSDSASSSSSSDSDSDSDASSASDTPTTSSKPSPPTTTPTILIFTNSTEEASRLHHLLTHLSPSLIPHTTLLTRPTTSTHPLTSLLPSSSSSSKTPLSSTTPVFKLLISTDRTSRGLDIPLTHVINYSVPRSLATYVHRVGRTARAGKNGEAWTLFEERQGRWFWREVVRGGGIRRVGGAVGVERVNLRLGGVYQGSVGKGGEEGKEKRKKEKGLKVKEEKGEVVEREAGRGRRMYEKVLEGMREIVGGQRKEGKEDKKKERKEGNADVVMKG